GAAARRRLPVWAGSILPARAVAYTADSVGNARGAGWLPALCDDRSSVVPARRASARRARVAPGVVVVVALARVGRHVPTLRGRAMLGVGRGRLGRLALPGIMGQVGSGTPLHPPQIR